MAESKSKLSAPLQKFAGDLKAMLIRSETSIREMRAREVSTKERKLEKHELCPLCGGPDVNGRCKCIETLAKNAQLGYGPGASVGGAGGGGGGEPMGMAEKKLAKCGSCGKGHMGKCDLSEVKPGKDLTKSGTTPHLDEVKPGKNLAKGMPSSSAAAIAPPKPRPATPVAAANKELGGFKSLVHSPTAMPGAAGPGLAPGGARKPLAHMGRPGVGNSATAGVIPHAKSEKGTGSPYGTGAAGHATQKDMPTNLKANMAPTKKGEKEMTRVVPATEKSVKGAKDPKAGKKVEAEGSGGSIKGGKALSKAAPAMGKAPAGKGVPGKQPVGQGGGDAHKVAAAAPAAKPNALKAAGTAEAGRLKGAANVQQLRGNLAGIAAQRAKPAHPQVAADLAGIKASRGAAPAAAAPADVDVDVSEFDKGPAKTSTAPQGNPGALQGVRDQANMAADKKSMGGVGFLRGLFSMFHSNKGNPHVDAAVQQLRGMNPGFAERGPTTSDSQGNVQTHPAGTQTGTLKRAPMTRVRGAMPLQRGEMDMRKAALSLTKKDIEEDAKKMEQPSPEMGLSGVNHNRRMLAVTRKRQVVKKNR